MLGHLNRINFVLLLLLGALCVFQWTGEKDTRSRINGLLRTSDAQAKEIADQAESLRATNEDLAGFRKQVVALKGQVDEQGARIRTQNSQIARLEQTEATLNRQLEVWKQGVEDYKAAVEARDAQITTLVEQRDQFYAANKASIERANQAVAALNDLNEKYSDVVTRYNDLVAQTQAETQPGNAAAAASGS